MTARSALTHHAIYGAGFMLLAACLLLFPLEAMAAGGGGGGGGGGNCPGNGLLERLVPCITKVMEQSTTRLANAISTYLWPAASAVIILAIIVYGIKMLSPEGSPKRTAIPMLIKIGAVVLFMQNFGGFIPNVHGGMKEMVDVLANALQIKSDCPSSGGGGGGGGGGSASGSDKLWKSMDCVMGKLFGFVGKDNNSMLIASVFGLAAGFFFGGSFGMIAFMGVIGLLLTTCIFVFKAAFAFLNGFMMACFAILISPIFIPMIMFQVSSNYYAKWLDLLIGSFIMPLLIVGYCIFALSIYNKVLFEGERAETIRKTMEKTFSESITNMRTECLGTLLNNVFFRVNGGGGSGDANKILKSPSVGQPAMPQQSGGQGLCIKVPNIDLQEKMQGFKNKQDFFRKIFTEGASVFLLAWLLLQGLQVITEVAQVMSRGAASLMSPLSKTESKLKAAMDNAEKKAKEAFTKEDGSSASGMEALGRIPHMIREGITGGLKGLQ